MHAVRHVPSDTWLVLLSRFKCVLCGLSAILHWRPSMYPSVARAEAVSPKRSGVPSVTLPWQAVRRLGYRFGHTSTGDANKPVLTLRA